MRIKDFSWSHPIGGKRPNAELCLCDVTSEELILLRDLAMKGDRIRIESKEYTHASDFDISLSATPSPSNVRPITINDIWPTDIIRNYSKRDVEVTSKMFGGFTCRRELKVKKVIFNKPATIVFWSDNTKTVVVCKDNDEYDAEKGFYIACTKKLFGNDFKAIGRMNKALEKAVVQTKEKKNDARQSNSGVVGS